MRRVSMLSMKLLNLMTLQQQQQWWSVYSLVPCFINVSLAVSLLVVLLFIVLTSTVGCHYMLLSTAPCPKINNTPCFKHSLFNLKFIDFSKISYYLNITYCHTYYDVRTLPCMLSVTSL